MSAAHLAFEEENTAESAKLNGLGWDKLERPVSVDHVLVPKDLVE